MTLTAYIANIYPLEPAKGRWQDSQVPNHKSAILFPAHVVQKMYKITQIYQCRQQVLFYLTRFNPDYGIRCGM